jgi:quercetin dioxygenase-like cupin family protein
MNPYEDNPISNNKFKRKFTQDISSNELVWHRDKNDRIVKVLESGNWKIQFDNQLPVSMKEGDSIFIEKESFHRVIKGDGDLVVEIVELKS